MRITKKWVIHCIKQKKQYTHEQWIVKVELWELILQVSFDVRLSAPIPPAITHDMFILTVANVGEIYSF